MIGYIKRHLTARLFVSYLLVILIIVVITGAILAVAAPNAYNRHLGVERQGAGELGKGGGQGSQQAGNFRDAVFEAFFIAVAAGVAVAVIISLLISRSIAAPVKAIAQASRRIAEGHYSERVKAPASDRQKDVDEIGGLGVNFNHMAESLEKTETMRRQLLADVSHELRTPLTTIRGTAEGLMDGVVQPDLETYRVLLAEAERMQHLVEDIQELSRVEAGQYQLQITKFFIKELLNRLEKRFDFQFREAGINLYIPDPGDIEMLADINRVDQVLQNLVGNALKYTHPGGTVEVRVSQDETGTHFSVVDNGRGLTHEDLKLVFTRFYRVDTSRARETGGSGIGLTIAKEWVEAHGGEIWAESEGLEKGSTFCFTIPLK